MTLKVRVALLFAALSLSLLVGSLGYIYFSHSASRQEEFYERLREQCERVATLLGEVKVADRQLLRIMDKNTIHRLRDEKVLVFDAADRLIYSSLDDEALPYSKDALARVREQGQVAYRDTDGDEVVGLHFKEEDIDVVVLASAFDTYGQRELQNLRDTLVVSLVLGLLFIFGASYFYIGFALRPIGRLDRAISDIDVDRLDQHLTVRGTRDELDRLAFNYNNMLERLRSAFDLQRAFVNNASHELRTPLARMNAQVEQALALPVGDARIPEALRMLQNDIATQGGLVESLLLLQRLKAHLPTPRSAVRVDETLFSVLEEMHQLHPHHQAKVDLDAGIESGEQLTVSINPLLFRTAIQNLVQNAALHAPDKEQRIHIAHAPGLVRMTFRNEGGSPLPPEHVFEPFFRGAGSERTRGSGLGLSIVRQVMADSGGKAWYQHQEGLHAFVIELPTTA